VISALAIALAVTPAAPQQASRSSSLAVQLFMDACVNGSARLVGARPISVHRMAGGSRKALFRAGRVAYFDGRKSPPVHFPEVGPAYLTSEYPLTYLVPQMPPNSKESSVPVCVALTKDKSAYWETQRAVRLWAKPGDEVPRDQPGLKVGDGLSQGGVISDQTFEARIGKQSVAVFRESSWVVMRTLDRGDRPNPYDKYKTGKKN
jgi:hypothetical protein